MVRHKILLKCWVALPKNRQCVPNDLPTRSFSPLLSVQSRCRCSAEWAFKSSGLLSSSSKKWPLVNCSAPRVIMWLVLSVTSESPPSCTCTGDVVLFVVLSVSGSVLIDQSKSKPKQPRVPSTRRISQWRAPLHTTIRCSRHQRRALLRHQTTLLPFQWERFRWTTRCFFEPKREF